MRSRFGVCLVLDNEALQVAADPKHPKARRLLALLSAANGRDQRLKGSVRVVTPTPVRVEAGLDRTTRAAVGLGLLRVHDEVLTSERADRAVALRAEAGGSAVDATVAQLAEEYAEFAQTTVLTSDFSDIPALVAATFQPATVTVRRI